MRQSRLLAQQATNRPLRIGDFRRRTWAAPRRVRRLNLSGFPSVRKSSIPGEFEEPPRSALLHGLRRGVCLTSDITLLVLLSPFFAAWFVYRGVLRLRRAR